MKPNYQESVSFLQWAHPKGPWSVVAITGDRTKPVEGKTFHPGQESQLVAWLEQHGETCNIYWTVNRIARDIFGKPRREDIYEMSFLHVDIDPRVGEDVDEERKRILELLQKAQPKPSSIIFSGGGYQALWRLSDPVEIRGQEDLYEQAKRYNLQLELLYGGDSCHNVDRILRLPGTINRPDSKKLKKGRTKKLAEVVYVVDASYPISSFQAAPELQAASDKGFGGNTVKISGNVQRVTDLSELAVSDLCKVVIAQGSDPDDPNRWPSRSEPLFWVCCEMVRADVKDETIFAVITDPEWAISSSVLEMGAKAERYAIRQIERAHEEAIDPWLRQLNEKWAVVMIGGKTRLITEEQQQIGDSVRSYVTFTTFQDFENYYRNKYIDAKIGDKDVSIPVGKWWLSHPKRREYQSVVFAPGKETPNSYNMWRGFAFPAKPGDCSLFLEHLKSNICSGSDEHYEYLLSWMAMAVQHPDQQGHIAVVLRGRQGTGKGAFSNVFGQLFGRHFLAVRDSNHLFGQFNHHLKDCVVLFCDEAFWAGNKKHEGMLKSLVTESTVVIEGKGRDAENAPNYLHLIMASNEEWVVPAGLDDRRFFVLDVSAQRMQDTRYFDDLYRQMKNGGYSALLHTLMTRDLKQFQVRRVPKTKALQNQKIRSMSPEQEWWMAKLMDGRIMETDEDWRTEVFCSELQYDYVSQSRLWDKRGHSSTVRLGLFLSQIMPEGGGNRIQVWGEHNVRQTDGTFRTVIRPYAYSVPSLDACRKHFDENFGGPYEWPDPKVVKRDEDREEPF